MDCSFITYVIILVLAVIINTITGGKDIKFVFLGAAIALLIFTVIQAKNQILKRIDMINKRIDSKR